MKLLKYVPLPLLIVSAGWYFDTPLAEVLYLLALVTGWIWAARL